MLPNRQIREATIGPHRHSGDFPCPDPTRPQDPRDYRLSLPEERQFLLSLRPYSWRINQGSPMIRICRVPQGGIQNKRRSELALSEGAALCFATYCVTR